jgi:DNA-binding CsgD family transcriptional regulator
VPSQARLNYFLHGLIRFTRPAHYYKNGTIQGYSPLAIKHGAVRVEVGARQMSNVNELENSSIEVRHCPDEHFVKFIRTLVALTVTCTEDDSEPAETLPAEQILFDLDIDGSRYKLIRSSVPAAERCTLSLSPREREIVRMVAQGRPNKVIAAVLNISSWTVCTHLRRIFAKLGVSSRAAMVAKVAADFEGAIDLKEAVVSALPRRRIASAPGAGQLHERP